MPSQTWTPLTGSRISAAHLPHGRGRTTLYCAASGGASGPPARTRRALELLLLLRVLVEPLEGRLKVIDDRDMASPLPLASPAQRLEFSRYDTPHWFSQ